MRHYLSSLINNSSMRGFFLLGTLLLRALPGPAQTGWSVLNIPDAGRYDDVFFINDTLGWAAGGPSGWIGRTTDGGATWTLPFTSTDHLRSIEFSDADNGFCGSLDGTFYRTTDGGDNWTDIAPGIMPNPPGICGLSAPNTSTIYGCGLWSGPAFIIKSVDGGDNWSTIDMSAYATRLVDIHFTSADTGFATGTAAPETNGGVILHTTNGGTTWTTVCTTNALTDIVWKIHGLDGQHWFASIYSDPVNDDTRTLRSNDGGMSWEQITVSGDYGYTEMVGFIDPLHGWVGGDTILWETFDGGDSWSPTSLGLSHNRFFKMNDSTAYLSGQFIYKYEDNAPMSTPPIDPRSVAHTLNVSPNPADGRFMVEIILDRTTIVELSVLASTGAMAKQLLHGRTPSGHYPFNVDLTASSAGTYLVVLKTNEGMQYRKVVVK